MPETNYTVMPHSGTITRFNDVYVVDPAVCDITLADVTSSDSGRNEAAEMAEMVIAQARNIHFEFKNIDQDSAAQILAIVSSAKHYYCEAYDPVTKRQASGEYYSGDRKISLVQWMDDERFDGKVCTLVFDAIDAKPARVHFDPSDDVGSGGGITVTPGGGDDDENGGIGLG